MAIRAEGDAVAVKERSGTRRAKRVLGASVAVALGAWGGLKVKTLTSTSSNYDQRPLL